MSALLMRDFSGSVLFLFCLAKKKKQSEESARRRIKKKGSRVCNAVVIAYRRVDRLGRCLIILLNAASVIAQHTHTQLSISPVANASHMRHANPRLFSNFTLLLIHLQRVFIIIIDLCIFVTCTCVIF